MHLRPLEGLQLRPDAAPARVGRRLLHVRPGHPGTVDVRPVPPLDEVLHVLARRRTLGRLQKRRSSARINPITDARQTSQKYSVMQTSVSSYGGVCTNSEDTSVFMLDMSSTVVERQLEPWAVAWPPECARDWRPGP